MRWIKYLPVLCLLFACESSPENDPLESRLQMLTHRKDSLVRVRTAEEKNLSSYEKGKSAEDLLVDNAYLLKAERVVDLDRQISFVNHEIRQVEKQMQAGQHPKK